MKPLSVASWPLDAARWLSLTASALEDAGVPRADIEAFKLRVAGLRTFPLLMDACMMELRKYYEVTA